MDSESRNFVLNILMREKSFQDLQSISILS